MKLMDYRNIKIGMDWLLKYGVYDHEHDCLMKDDVFPNL